ncbi:MAG: hypothetical protein HYY06_12780 [Deltaproteobacteria bacterium]|nr:hypothetical protein [Deltaproteobacteria bacterium]
MKGNGERKRAATKRQPAAAGAPAGIPASAPASIPAGPAAGAPGQLTRSQVAERLGTSIASVRRLEGKKLHPRRGPRGVWLFDPAELAAVAEEQTSSLTAKPRRSADGDVAAEAFARFNRGLGPREVVVELRQPPHVIIGLHRVWCEHGGLWLPSATVSSIRKAVGARYDDLRTCRITTPQDLLDVIHVVLAGVDADREHFRRCRDEVRALRRQEQVLREKLRARRARIAELAARVEVREARGAPDRNQPGVSSPPASQPPPDACLTVPRGAPRSE